MTEFDFRYRLLDYKGEPYKNKFGHEEHQRVSLKDKNSFFMIPAGFYWEEFLVEIK